MIRYVADVMLTDFPTVDVLDGLRYAQAVAARGHFESLPVMEENQIVGVVDYWDMVRAHPNRIVADAMSDQFMYVKADMPVWEAKEVIDRKGVKLLVVLDQKNMAGIVSPSRIEMEIGRHIDILTGLYKADYIYYHAMKLIKHNQVISVIFLDVNNFGQIDKKYGHINGDHILQEVGELLKEYMTEETYLSRFGGDEFLVLTPYRLEECRIFAEKLLQVVRHHTFHESIPVSFSAGIARGGGHSQMKNMTPSLEKIINCASLASTKAKKECMELVVSNQLEFG